MSISKAEKKLEQINEIEDLGQKRFLMFQALEDSLKEIDIDSIDEINGLDGYLYKITQDFLTSSSTYEKNQLIKEIVERVDDKYTD